MRVKLYRGQLQLNSKHASYSYGNIHKLWYETMRTEQVGISNAQRILILGFGAGSIAEHLRSAFLYSGVIDAVEIDAEVMKLYTLYFAEAEHQPLHIHISDAFKFIVDANEMYDFIFVDLFNDIEPLKEIYEAQFIKNCKARLSTNGKLIINTISNSKEQYHQIQSFLLDLSSIFKEVSITPYQSFNHIIKCK
ncbi:methyltransferase [bacterium]|nr:methyltransferase [bacterium]